MYSRKLELFFVVCYTDARFQKHITGRGVTLLLNWRSLSRKEKFCDLHPVFSLLTVQEACPIQHDISFSVDPAFPRYFNSRTCSVSSLSHIRCKGESINAIVFVLSVLILSSIGRPLPRTSFSNSLSLCLQDSMSLISSAKSKSLTWCSTFNYMVLLPVIRTK